MTRIFIKDFYLISALMTELKYYLNIVNKNNKNAAYAYCLNILEKVKKIAKENELNDDTITKLEFGINKLRNFKIENNILPSKEVHGLHGLVVGIDTIIRFEIDSFSCYDLHHDSTLNIYKLEAEGAMGFFGSEVWNKLSNIAKADFEEGARCLLFSLPTASAIMMLRGTEDVMRQYQTYLASRDATPSTKKLRMWGEIIKDLEGRGVSASIIGYLKYLKEEMRNPLNHPEMIVNVHEAEGIFFSVKDAVVKIINQIS